MLVGALPKSSVQSTFCTHLLVGCLGCAASAKALVVIADAAVPQGQIDSTALHDTVSKAKRRFVKSGFLKHTPTCPNQEHLDITVQTRGKLVLVMFGGGDAESLPKVVDLQKLVGEQIQQRQVTYTVHALVCVSGVETGGVHFYLLEHQGNITEPKLMQYDALQGRVAAATENRSHRVIAFVLLAPSKIGRALVTPNLKELAEGQQRTSFATRCARIARSNRDTPEKTKSLRGTKRKASEGALNKDLYTKKEHRARGRFLAPEHRPKDEPPTSQNDPVEPLLSVSTKSASEAFPDPALTTNTVNAQALHGTVPPPVHNLHLHIQNAVTPNRLGALAETEFHRELA